MAFEQYALYTLLFSLPLQALALIPGTSLTVTKVGGALLITSVVARQLLHRRPPFGRTGLEGAIALFALACVLSLLGSVNRHDSLQAVKTLSLYVLTFYAVAQVSSRNHVQKHIPSLFVGSVVLSALGALLALFGRIIPPTVDTVLAASNIRRLSFGLPDANEQALLFLFALGFLLFNRVCWKGPGRRALSSGAFAAITIGMILTMSRTGWLCAAGLLGLRALFDRNRVRYCAALMILAAVAAGIIAVAQPRLLELARRRAVEAISIGDTSVASRVTHYATVVDTAQDGGPFGHGLATTLQISSTFRDPLGKKINATVHNVPLIFWLELGWVGLLCFGWLWSSVIALLYSGYRRASTDIQRDRIAAYAALVATYGVVSLVMPFIYRSGFAILLGCAVGAVLPVLSPQNHRPRRTQ